MIKELAFVAKLAVLVPPPEFPTVTYHGVQASAHPMRKAVVPGGDRRVPRLTVHWFAFG